MIEYTPSGEPMATPVPLIEDGEVLNFNDLMVDVIEPMIDGIALAQDTLGLSAGSVDRFVAIQWNTGNAGEWAYGAGSVSVPYWVDAGTGNSIFGTIDLPHGSTVTAISLYVDPAAHASIAGMTKPFFNVIQNFGATDTGGGIAVGADPSASAGAYNVYHAVTTTSALSGAPIDRSTSTYHIAFVGESGANSAALLKLYGFAKITYHY